MMQRDIHLTQLWKSEAQSKETSEVWPQRMVADGGAS